MNLHNWVNISEKTFTQYNYMFSILKRKSSIFQYSSLAQINRCSSNLKNTRKISRSHWSGGSVGIFLSMLVNDVL